MSTESKLQGQDLFRLTPHANINGTHLLTRIACAPSCLVELFGPPAAGDEDKVSGMYCFESPSGDVFTVYDWKATTLHWGRGSGAPTPKRFWKKNTPQDLMIGGDGKTSPEPFIKWLVETWERHEKALEPLLARLSASLQRTGRF